MNTKSSPFVPTSDPEKALAFCRQLAALLDGSAGADLGVVANARGTTFATVSIVIPVFNEETNIVELYNRLALVFRTISTKVEFVFVNDGSRDQSLRILHELAASDDSITVVDLSRNFGHQIATSAGIDVAVGDAVVVMDADLQDSPEVSPEFVAKWQEGFDVVFAVRRTRKESIAMRAAYSVFYRALAAISHVSIPLDAGDFCLMDRRVVELLKQVPERNRFVRGIRSWIGLRQVGIEVDRGERYSGSPKYTIRSLVTLALDGLVSFSFVPLRLIGCMGVGISVGAIGMAIFYLVKKFTVGLSPPGFATIVVLLCFLAGIQLITIGIMSEYVGRIFEEVKRRPLYIIGSKRQGVPRARSNAE
jgi:glycosyltransferase involved in cell wall biosynthesis